MAQTDQQITEVKFDEITPAKPALSIQTHTSASHFLNTEIRAKAKKSTT